MSLLHFSLCCWPGRLEETVSFELAGTVGNDVRPTDDNVP